MNRLGLSRTLAFRALAGFIFSLYFLNMPLQWPSKPGELLLLALSIALIPLAVNVCYFIGLRRGSLGNQVALFQSVPVFTLVTVSLLNLTIPAIPVIGSAMILLLGCGLLTKNTQGGKLSWGMGLLSALIAGVAIVVQEQVLLSMSREALILTQTSSFFLITVGATWILPQPTAAQPTYKEDQNESNPDPNINRKFWTGVGLAIFSGVLMLVGFDWLKYLTLETLGPVVTASLLLTRLPFAQILGFLVFKEIPSRHEIWGSIVVIMGALLLSFFGSFD